MERDMALEWHGRRFGAALAPRLVMAMALLGSAASAQDAAPSEVRRMCDSVKAVVMLSKVTCTAALCNTGASQGGWTGLLTQALHGGAAIDATSFSNGVASQLATALKQTGCFDVVDAASVEELRKEMEAMGKTMAAPRHVDFILRASIVKADLVIEESGFLAYKKKTATSSLTLDTKLVNARQGVVTEAGIYDATVDRSSSGVDLGFYSSSSDAARRGTPFSDVARELVVKAATGLTGKILALPVEDPKPVDAGAPASAASAAASAAQ